MITPLNIMITFLAIQPSSTTKQSVGASCDQSPAVKWQRGWGEKAGNEWVSCLRAVYGSLFKCFIPSSVGCQMPETGRADCTCPDLSWNWTLILFHFVFCVLACSEKPTFIKKKKRGPVLYSCSPFPVSSSPGLAQQNMQRKAFIVLRMIFLTGAFMLIRRTQYYSYYTCQPKSWKNV